MSLGGGSYTIENKVLPGAYINFITAKRGSVEFGERGVGALGLCLDWGSDKVVVVEKENIRQDCKKLFGYDYNHESMIAIREFFRHANKLIAYRLNSGGTKASFNFGEAKYSGTRGNDIVVVVSRNIDDTAMFDVATYIDGDIVDMQTVNDYTGLKDNDFIKWKGSIHFNSGTYRLSGGTTSDITGADVTRFCTAMESYTFNAISIIFDDSEMELVLLEYTKRMRDERGVKFQCVTYYEQGDHEGVVTIYNGASTTGYDGNNMVAWVCGALAGCQINESLTNTIYDGEINITACDNSNLEFVLKNGYFAFHKVDDEIRVLKDINTLVSFSENKGEIMQNNQTVRVCDQIAMDIARLFGRYYLGKVPNDKAGRNSLWSELVRYHEQLAAMRAIEDFDEEDIEVLAGQEKTSVVVNESIVPVNAMDKLYMRVYIE